jgi:hypothetical protein
MGGRIKREVKIDPLPPRLGKIKCGIKSDRGFPQSIDYFVASGKYAPLFDAVYQKANSLLVYFPSDDPDLVCKECYIYRDKAGKKIAEGDGEEFIIWSEKQGKRVKCSVSETPNLMQMIETKYPSPTGWQVTLTLNVCLPMVNKIFGVWTFETRAAASSIPQIRDTFDAMLERNGHISGVLCDLNVAFAKSDSPRASRFPVVTLVPNETSFNTERVKAICGGEPKMQ